MNFFKKLFCKHKNSEVVCWHWTHGQIGNDPIFLEIQRKCLNCGKYYFEYIRDQRKYDEFVERYSDKEWSSMCNPVL